MGRSREHEEKKEEEELLLLLMMLLLLMKLLDLLMERPTQWLCETPERRAPTRPRSAGAKMPTERKGP